VYLQHYLEAFMDWNTPSPLDLERCDPKLVFAAGLALHHLANTAYPIAHLSTMRPYKIPRSAIQETAPKAWEEIDRLGLYVHVPFCQARCGFCEYTVVDPLTNRDSVAPYFDLLQREFELYRQALETQSKTLIGFDIGGGTPSVASLADIGRLLEATRRNFRWEAGVFNVSIETTPRIAAAEPEKIRTYFSMGIRRISMGVQTVNLRLLQAVGREHTSPKYDRAAAEAVRRAGFTSFNIDVMYGFAGQSIDSLEATLRHVIDLAPDHVTLYRMRYKGTRLAGQAVEVDLSEVIAQAGLARDLLQAAGYNGASGKNTFSRLPGDPGTSDYLTERVVHGTPYLGLGLGAQSLSHQTLAYNSGAADKRLEHYRRQLEAGLLPIQDLYHLSLPAAMGKMVSVAFYFGAIHRPSFERKFGLSLEQAFPAEVDFILRRGLMEYAAGPAYGTRREGYPTPAGSLPELLRLTPEGERQVNGLIALFYAGAVKEHLLQLAASNLPAPGRVIASARSTTSANSTASGGLTSRESSTLALPA
jgi:oxygen-independent coproporphyrinogen III oxidase